MLDAEPSAKPPLLPNEGRGDPNRPRTRRQVGDRDYLYLIQLRLKGGGFSTLVALTHETRFSEKEMEEMVKEAVAVVNEVRIPNRRQEWAKRQVRVTDRQKLNESAFEQDLPFFEAVMVDKFDFKKMLYEAVDGEIVPTIL